MDPSDHNVQKDPKLGFVVGVAHGKGKKFLVVVGNPVTVQRSIRNCIGVQSTRMSAIKYMAHIMLLLLCQMQEKYLLAIYGLNTWWLMKPKKCLVLLVVRIDQNC